MHVILLDGGEGRGALVVYPVIYAVMYAVMYLATGHLNIIIINKERRSGKVSIHLKVT